MMPETVKRYRLKLENPYIDPRLINLIAGTNDVAAGPDNTLLLHGLTVDIVSDEIIPEGTPLVVRLQRGVFDCCFKSDLEQLYEEQRKQELMREAKENEIKNKLRLRADEFNSRIMLPVKWDVGIKHVLSGLSEKSWGSGHNRATVNHIVVLEKMEIGRTIRQAGDFLCSSNSKQNGMQYLPYVDNIDFERYVDGNGNIYKPEITCKQCIKTLERMKLISAGIMR